jgi:lysyl endopeptidase
MHRIFAGILLVVSVAVRGAQAAPGVSTSLETSAHTRSFDRASAYELARLIAPAAARLHASPNLRQDGVVETLRQPIALPAAVIGKIVVNGAATIRLRITGAGPGAVIWVGGDNDSTFERFEPGDTATWTPTTEGSTVYITVEGAGDGLEIAQVAMGTPQTDSTDSACMLDVACGGPSDLPELSDASRAIALLRFVRGDASYVCTGGLMKDAIDSGTPYLLTAHHCISTPEEAASIEAVWDDRSESCGSVAPFATMKRTYGAELLVSSAATDVALLRMNRIPANRVFLGVALEPLAGGTPTYRLSHADGATQKYSAGVVHDSGPGCASAPRPLFLYSTPTAGAVSMGSSGGPLLVAGLRVAGQLLGLCGPSPKETCAIYNDVVDGSITASWPLLSPYLDRPANSRRRSAQH